MNDRSIEKIIILNFCKKYEKNISLVKDISN